jgi:hypothetical protein
MTGDNAVSWAWSSGLLKPEMGRCSSLTFPLNKLEKFPPDFQVLPAWRHQWFSEVAKSSTYSPSFGHATTLLDHDLVVALPPGYMSFQRILCSCCWAPTRVASPSGLSPTSVSLAWRGSISTRHGGEGFWGHGHIFHTLFDAPNAQVRAVI